MMLTVIGRFLSRGKCSRSDEQGWALLGLLLALGVMSIVLVSSIVPNVQMQVQREKEAEMIYRGEQMAQGIARYYGRGALLPLQISRLQATPLTDLAKVREGVTIGVREIKLVRLSATIDPMISADWEPVRLRDPRISRFLQAWAAETQAFISPDYELIAGPPPKIVLSKPDSTLPKPGAEGGDQGKPTPPNPISPPGSPQAKPPAQKPEDGDDDDDDDDEPNDPLAHLFESSGPGKSNLPIVGVAPTKKGKSSSSYFGLGKYEDWVFIYIPKNIQPGIQRPVPGGVPGGAPGRTPGAQPVKPPGVMQ